MHTDTHTSMALVAIAIPLQLMGMTSTCTQGANGTFLFGSMLSTPLLIAAIVLIAKAAIKRNAHALGMATVVGLALLTLGLTSSVWIGTLIHETPCGPDYSGLYSSTWQARGFILTGYALLPILVVVVSIAALLFSRTTSLQSE